MEKESKKAAYDNGADRLSGLPDEILCHILSFLDTKYAVATSVVSTRWRNLCKQVPNIILDYKNPTLKQSGRAMSECDYAEFGLRQMMSLNVPYIDKFHLKCNSTVPLTQKLICTAVSRSVKELHICIGSSYYGEIILPPDIFTSRSLAVMNLEWHLSLPIPQLVCLPNLKVLHLKEVIFHDSLRRLFDGCKLLQDLSLTSCTTMEHDDVLVDLSLPSLRKLAIKCMSRADKLVIDTPNMPGADILVIDTPNLEFFEYEGKQVEFQLVNKLESLTSARICFTWFVRDGENMWFLINKMHGIKFLYLSDYIAQHIYWSCSSLPVVFENLTRLELGFFNLQALVIILGSTPQLQELAIFLPRVQYYWTISDPKDSCPVPNVVPTCFAGHLKSIVFKRFLALEYEFELANYLLENGKVLKTVKFAVAVHQLRREGLLETFNRIAKLPKSSEKCEIVFVSHKT